LPILWRLLQCLRRYRDTRDYHQLINAGKYGTALLVTGSSAIRRAKPMIYTDIIWFLCVFAGTVYSFVWDVIKDWSLGSIRNVKHKFLRSELLYPTAWYYTALIMNLGMRLMWTLTISPEAVRGTLHPDLFAYVLALVEMTRRAVWNMFRLENEQLNNCGNFRAIKEVPLPLPTSEPEEE
jgi:xenotropic and polytropic retrovirus receptor 1